MKRINMLFDESEYGPAFAPYFCFFFLEVIGPMHLYISNNIWCEVTTRYVRQAMEELILLNNGNKDTMTTVGLSQSSSAWLNWAAVLDRALFLF